MGDRLNCENCGGPLTRHGAETNLNPLILRRKLLITSPGRFANASRPARALVRFTLAGMLAAVPLAALSVTGACGQDVATCSSICTVTATSSCTGTLNPNCVTDCQSYQQTCQTQNAGGDFQALVTCIADSHVACNGFASIPPLCTDLAKTATTQCGATPLP